VHIDITRQKQDTLAKFLKEEPQESAQDLAAKAKRAVDELLVHAAHDQDEAAHDQDEAPSDDDE
jgi:hypothetical protein